MNEASLMSPLRTHRVQAEVVALLIAILSTVLLLAAGGSARSLPLPSDDLVIAGGTLIDGTGHRPIENSIVVVRGNRIVAAGKNGEVRPPKDPRAIQAA